MLGTSTAMIVTQKWPIAVVCALFFSVCVQIDAHNANDNEPHPSGRRLNTRAAVGSTSSDPIPMEFYRELDEVKDMPEFYERFVNKTVLDPKLGVLENLEHNVERRNAARPLTPQKVNCIPENAVVPLTPLNPSDDPGVIYHPKCVRVKRCSGCCSSGLMSCQPVEKEVLTYEVKRYNVVKYKYSDASVSNRDIAQVEQHLSCKCDCIIKAEHCKPYQVYSPDQCRCFCANDDALEKCLQLEHKHWNDTTCSCECRGTQSCTTGTIYNDTLCQCVKPFDDDSTNTELDRRRFIVKAIPVEPNDDTVYTHV